MLAEAEEVEDEHADLIADILDTVGKIYRKPQSVLPPNCLHPGSRILIKEFKYFYPQKTKKIVSKL